MADLVAFDDGQVHPHVNGIESMESTQRESQECDRILVKAENCLDHEPSCDHSETLIVTSEVPIDGSAQTGVKKDQSFHTSTLSNRINAEHAVNGSNLDTVDDSHQHNAIVMATHEAAGDQPTAYDDIKDEKDNETESGLTKKEENLHTRHVGDLVGDVDSQNKANLEEGDTNSEVDILGNGLLMKKVVSCGDGRCPKHGEVVTVSLAGKTVDDRIVDTHDSLSFILGDGDVITGLELCLPLMKLNETCTLLTDCKYAYGSHGNGADIPPHASITYTITLTTISPAPDYKAMAITEIVELSETKRQRGNYYFERGDYSSAITSYTKAVRIADSHKTVSGDTSEMLQALLDVWVKCYNNLAASQLKIEAYVAAIKSCDSVLKYSSENVKALFRKAKACTALGRLKEACELLKKALQLEPESRLIHMELSRLANKMKNESESAKKMYQKMFGLDVSPNKPKSKQWATWSLTLAGAIIVMTISVGVALYRRGT